jgi:[ribosomal protein S18]-alanine N-acetyltransferase
MTETDISSVGSLEDMFVSPWSADSLAAELKRLHGIQLIAFGNEKPEICGWCCAAYGADEAELLKIAVHVSCQHKGIGSALLHQLLQELSISSVQKLFLEVREENLQARNFYFRHGFSQVGFRPHYYTDPPDNALVLARDFVTDSCGSLNSHKEKL